MQYPRSKYKYKYKYKDKYSIDNINNNIIIYIFSYHIYFVSIFIFIFFEKHHMLSGFHCSSVFRLRWTKAEVSSKYQAVRLLLIPCSLFHLLPPFLPIFFISFLFLISFILVLFLLQELEKLDTLLSYSDRNSESYRNVLKRTQPPCLPYLYVFVFVLILLIHLIHLFLFDLFIIFVICDFCDL